MKNNKESGKRQIVQRVYYEHISINTATPALVFHKMQKNLR